MREPYPTPEARGLADQLHFCREVGSSVECPASACPYCEKGEEDTDA